MIDENSEPVSGIRLAASLQHDEDTGLAAVSSHGASHRSVSVLPSRRVVRTASCMATLVGRLPDEIGCVGAIRRVRGRWTFLGPVEGGSANSGCAASWRRPITATTHLRAIVQQEANTETNRRPSVVVNSEGNAPWHEAGNSSKATIARAGHARPALVGIDESSTEAEDSTDRSTISGLDWISWGGHDLRSSSNVKDRTIPAWAGNTFTDQCGNKQLSGHPRASGERVSQLYALI